MTLGKKTARPRAERGLSQETLSQTGILGL